MILDPPDFVAIDKNNNQISIEVTEVHSDIKKNSSPSRAKLGKYHKLLKNLKENLKKAGLSNLYGVIFLKCRCDNRLSDESFLKKENNNRFIDEIIKVIKSLNIDSQKYSIKNNDFTTRSLLKKCVDQIYLTDYSKESTEREFYWWFSHLQSGENRTYEITCKMLNSIIAKKFKKLKKIIEEKKYQENWLIIYSTDFGLKDVHNPPKIERGELDNKLFDRIYFVSSFFGVTVLYDK